MKLESSTFDFQMRLLMSLQGEAVSEGWAAQFALKWLDSWKDWIRGLIFAFRAVVMLTKMNFFMLAQVRGLGERWLTPSALVRFFAKTRETSIDITYRSKLASLCNLTPCGSVGGSRALSSGRKICYTLRMWTASRWNMKRNFDKRSTFEVNFQAQTHPVWMRSWFLRWVDCANPWPHVPRGDLESLETGRFLIFWFNSPQMYGFSLEDREQLIRFSLSLRLRELTRCVCVCGCLSSWLWQRMQYRGHMKIF